MKKKILEFDCPACGNPIPRTDNERMRCPWCRTLIIPQGFKKDRPARICDTIKDKEVYNEKSKDRKTQ